MAVSIELVACIPEMKGVILKDGTRIPYLADGGNVGYTDATHAYHITGYDRVVDVDEIQSLLLLVKPGEEPVSVDIQRKRVKEIPNI